MLFSCLSTGIENRFMDVSHLAVPSPFFPATVGLRSQALKLSFVDPKVKGWFLRPTLFFHQAMEMFTHRFNRHHSEDIFHQAHIGESVSILYAPFYLDDGLVDGVLNQPIPKEPDTIFDINQFTGGPADWRVRFIPTLCPDCGWDMKGGHKDALVLFCKNCDTHWQATKNGLVRVEAAHMPGNDAQETIYLPFWRVRATVTGIDLSSYADLVKTANLAKAVQPGWEKRPFSFWGPAFKVRPKSFLRLTHQITMVQPREELVASGPRGNVHPVNLPVSESIETMKVNLAGIIRQQKHFAKIIEAIQVTPKSYLLVYFPFSVRHHDLVQPTLNIAVNRNQLALAGNL